MEFCTVVTLVQIRPSGHSVVRTMHGTGETMTDANASALEALVYQFGRLPLSSDQSKILLDLYRRKAHLETYVQSINKMVGFQANMHGFSINENV